MQQQTARDAAYEIDQKITVLCPPSIVLDAVGRYFTAQNNVIWLVVPLRCVGYNRKVALAIRALVEFESHPNKAVIARFDDRIVIGLTPADREGPHFKGRLTIRPRGSHAELALKGTCTAPAEFVDTFVWDVVFDSDLAEATIRFLLEELKRAVEAEFRELRSLNEPTTPLRTKHTIRIGA